MKMRKYAFILMMLFISLAMVSLVQAESSTNGANLKDNLDKAVDQYDKRMDQLQKKVDVAKTNKVEKVRTAVGSRSEAYARFLSKEEEMLNKLQIRIDRAKSSGVNTGEMEKLMADSRSRLSAARIRLNSLSSQNNTATDKKQFEAVKSELKLVWQNMKAIKENSAKIIKSLKAFNRSANAPTPKLSTTPKASPSGTAR